LIPVRYGESLVVYYCSRLDLVHLKLYAAVDVRGRHLDDLKGMESKTKRDRISGKVVPVSGRIGAVP
jgi:hypothetical protein